MTSSNDDRKDGATSNILGIDLDLLQEVEGPKKFSSASQARSAHGNHQSTSTDLAGPNRPAKSPLPATETSETASSQPSVGTQQASYRRRYSYRKSHSSATAVPVESESSVATVQQAPITCVPPQAGSSVALVSRGPGAAFDELFSPTIFQPPRYLRPILSSRRSTSSLSPRSNTPGHEAATAFPLPRYLRPTVRRATESRTSHTPEHVSAGNPPPPIIDHKTSICESSILKMPEPSVTPPVVAPEEPLEEASTKSHVPEESLTRAAPADGNQSISSVGVVPVPDSIGLLANLKEVTRKPKRSLRRTRANKKEQPDDGETRANGETASSGYRVRANASSVADEKDSLGKPVPSVVGPDATEGAPRKIPRIMRIVSSAPSILEPDTEFIEVRRGGKVAKQDPQRKKPLSHAIKYDPFRGAEFMRNEGPINCIAAHIFPQDYVHFVKVIFCGDSNDESHLEKYANFLHEGFRGYGFMAFTRTQFQETKNCIMVKPYQMAAELRKLCDLEKLNAAKQVKYSGLLFNELHSIQIVSISNIIIKDDVERNGYCFTDGCGLISDDLVKELVPKEPSTALIQIRAPGVKGVLLRDPSLPPQTILIRKSMKKLDIKRYQTNDTDLESEQPKVDVDRIWEVGANSQESALVCKDDPTVGGLDDLIETSISTVADDTVSLPKSDRPKGPPMNTAVSVLMEKRLPLAVLKASRPERCGSLNSQIVSLLLQRGLPADVILAKDRQYKDATKFSFADAWATLDLLYLTGRWSIMHSVLKIIKIEDEKALRKVCSSAPNFQREEIASWRKKKRRGVSLLQGNNEFKGESDPERRLYLPLLNSRRLLGAADPIEVLQPSDCFVQVTQNDGTRLVVTGKVAVARNPCYHPGDILLLNAVDIQPLRYISDIVVFSSLGDRPAPDMSSGGDLDGDDFLLIWDPDIVAGLKDHEPFDYRPQRLEPLIRNIASKLGIQTRSAGGGSKTNLIKMLTQKADPDSIGRIDSLFLEFRKFEYRDDAGGVLTKEELQNLLVAMFSASVDRLGFDIGSLMTAVQQELWKCRTSNLTPEHEVLQKCVLSTDSAAEFILESNRDPELIFQFFRESLANDGSWKRDDFLATFRPPLRRENADVAVKMLNMAERLFADEPGALPQVPENVSDALNKYVRKSTIKGVHEAIFAAEKRIEKLREECSTSDIRRVYDSFKFQKQEEKHWNDILESSTDEEERRCARIQLKTIIDSIDELTHSTLLNDTRLVNEYKTTLEAWKAAVERLSSFVKILEIVANRLLTSNHVSRDVSECDAILSQELRIFSSILPIYDCRRKIAEFWSNESRVCLILSETGSGKSTCLPQFLANELYMKDLLTPSKPIIVAQPRRIATTSLARRLAEDRFTNVGDVIGAHIGKSKAVAKKHRTVIICTTYGILLSYARRDPLLRGFTCIILDEVHEDSTDLYFLFGIVQHAMKHNPLLKVFLMSAKVNSDMLCEFFKNCEIIKVKGRGFPIKEHFAEDKLTMDEKEYLDYAIQEASDIHQTTPLNENPDILVFLPKIGSINTACDQFEKKIRDYLSPDECLNFFQFALHSKVDEEDKRFILRRSEIEAERHEERRALVLGDFLPDSNVDSVRENTQVDTDERQESTGLPLDSADGATSSSLAMEEQSSSNGNTLPKADLDEKQGRLDRGDPDEREETSVKLNLELDELLRGSETDPDKTEAKAFPLNLFADEDIIWDDALDPFKLRPSRNDETTQSESSSDEDAPDEEEPVPAQFDGTRRVIFCTNIAETSLTIPRVGYVIDSGLRLQVSYTPMLHIKQYSLEMTTAVSAIQRKGRAGRLGPGICRRLYRKEDMKLFPEQIYSNPESLDLLLLSLIEMYGDFKDFPWFIKPTDEALKWTVTVLQDLKMIQAIDPDKFMMTQDGRFALEVARLEISVPLARFLLNVWTSTKEEQVREDSVVIAALLSTDVDSLFNRKFWYYEEKMSQVSEAITSPGRLPSTICKLNAFYTWRAKGRKRRHWCRKFRISHRTMKDVDETQRLLFKYLKKRQDLFPDESNPADGAPETATPSKTLQLKASDHEHRNEPADKPNNDREVDNITSKPDSFSDSTLHPNNACIESSDICSIEDGLEDLLQLQCSYFDADTDDPELVDSFDPSSPSSLQLSSSVPDSKTMGCGSLDLSSRLNVIMSNLVLARFTNIGCVNGGSFSERSGPEAEFLYGEKTTKGRVDRSEAERYGEIELPAIVMFHSPKQVRQSFFLADLDTISPALADFIPSKYLEKYSLKFQHFAKIKSPSDMHSCPLDGALEHDTE